MTALTPLMVLEKTKKAYKIPELKYLRSLNLWGMNLRDVSYLAELNCLKVLSLSCNQIQSLKAFGELKELQELYLRSNHISDAHELHHLQPLSALRVLTLMENPIAEFSGYRSLVLRCLPELTHLDDLVVGERERADAKVAGSPFGPKGWSMNDPSKSNHHHHHRRSNDLSPSFRFPISMKEMANAYHSGEASVSSDEEQHGIFPFTSAASEAQNHPSSVPSNSSTSGQGSKWSHPIPTSSWNHYTSGDSSESASRYSGSHESSKRYSPSLANSPATNIFPWSPHIDRPYDNSKEEMSRRRYSPVRQTVDSTGLSLHSPTLLFQPKEFPETIRRAPYFFEEPRNESVSFSHKPIDYPGQSLPHQGSLLSYAKLSTPLSSSLPHSKLHFQSNVLSSLSDSEKRYAAWLRNQEDVATINAKIRQAGRQDISPPLNPARDSIHTVMEILKNLDPLSLRIVTKEAQSLIESRARQA